MRVVLLGLDAFDPNFFEGLYEQGRLPNLARFVEGGGYSCFSVPNPPQSEVSWTSIATGLNPGGHGLFDFVHRDPATYALNVSLLPTKRGFGGTRFVAPFSARTIFDQAVQRGYPATALWWPAMFPARVHSPVRTLPGLGTPDILGRLGVGTCYTTNKDLADDGRRKTAVLGLTPSGGNRYRAGFVGPMRKKGDRAEASIEAFELELTGDKSADLITGKKRLELQLGRWSPIIEVTFKVGFFFSVRALTRVILTEVYPHVNLYVLPLQLHPVRAPWPYATPPRFVKQIWKACGPFLTLGWPQDTTALEEKFIDDNQFLELCHSIFSARVRVLMHQLDQFDEGIIASVFDTLDRVQHMFWRDRPDIVEQWYERLDVLVGQVTGLLHARGLFDSTRLVIVSDHGFTNFDYKVHLNRWLVDRGYLVPLEGTKSGSLQNVDWSKSRAYALGLNSIYLNLAGREGMGSVRENDMDNLLSELSTDLAQWRGLDGRPVVQRVYPRQEAFDGPLMEYGPDIVVGYSPGYRGSQQTGLGLWERDCLAVNGDHWNADHCVDADSVPGVIFTSHGLNGFSRPSYRDIPAITIESSPDSTGSAPPPEPMADEDERIIEERLRSLGYL
jgi:predicted AlkP superfamily phosphohydrolase/phosphomutase